MRMQWRGRSSTSRRAVLDAAITIAVVAVAGAAVWPILFKGWQAGDDGGMGLVAQRVLAGQLPHRDFEDPWTGGWSFFQAAIFARFGVTLAMLRVPIFVAWLAGIALSLRIARRDASAPMAALAALACATWSLYAHHFPLLGWYYAPLALLGMWAVCRFEDSGRGGWLVVAGASAGLALLVKVTGLFLLAALLLWSLARAGERIEKAGPDHHRGFAALTALLLAAFVGSVLLLLARLPRELWGTSSLHYLVPVLGLAAWAMGRSLRGGRSLTGGVADLATLAGLILAGVLLAIAPLLWHYARLHAMHDLLVGVFVRPSVRLNLVTYGSPGRLVTLAALVPPIVLFVAAQFATVRDATRDAWMAALLGAAWGALSLIPGLSGGEALSTSVRAIPIVLPFFAMWYDRTGQLSPGRAPLVFLLVSTATTSQLVQVPFAGAYFLYVAPLGILATFVLFADVARAARRGALLFWGSFLVVGGINRPVMPFDRARTLSTLPFVRGGLQVEFLDSVRYARLAAVVRTRPPGPIFVIGNAPEVPFLLERASASRTIYDILADSAERDPAAVSAGLDRDGVLTVVIHHDFRQTSAPDAALSEVLRREFPESRMDWPFEVRWRTAVPSTHATGDADRRGTNPI